MGFLNFKMHFPLPFTRRRQDQQKTLLLWWCCKGQSLYGNPAQRNKSLVMQTFYIVKELNHIELFFFCRLAYISPVTLLPSCSTPTPIHIAQTVDYTILLHGASSLAPALELPAVSPHFTQLTVGCCGHCWSTVKWQWCILKAALFFLKSSGSCLGAGVAVLRTALTVCSWVWSLLFNRVLDSVA